jgi:hypothetical protein
MSILWDEIQKKLPHVGPPEKVLQTESSRFQTNSDHATTATTTTTTTISSESSSSDSRANGRLGDILDVYEDL